MSDAPSLRAAAPLAWLLFCPAVAVIASRVPDLGRATMPVGAGAGLVALIVALGLASHARLTRPLALGALVLGVAWIGVAYFAHGVGLAHLLAGELALLAIGHVVGSAIGLRVEHAGHVLPATAVAIAADVASVISPEGPSHAIASDEASLRALVVAFPLPGGEGFTYLVGLGDLVFVALLFGVAAKHGVPRLRVAAAAIVGGVASLAASARLEMAVPALVGIGLAAVALVPAFRTVRPKERTLVVGACVGAVIIVAVVLARAALAAR